METYDLIIIGGGPTGLNCAIAAGKAGLRYLVLEKGVLANSIYNFPVNMTFFSTSKLLEIGNTPFISHGEKPTRREALEYYRRLQQSFGLNVRTYEAVSGMSRQANGLYRVRSEKKQYEAHSVIVATGFYDTPRLMDVPGEQLPKVKHYYDDAHPYVGQKILVVGAANSACQVALETWRKGAEVTMAIRAGKIYKGVKYWIKPDIEEMIEAVDWTTLVFFMTLFISVGAIQEVGLISFIASGIGRLVGENLTLAMLAVIWLSAVLSTVIANIPFTAAMLPVIGFLSGSIPGAESKVLFYCLSVGSAMGGNGSLIGASANMVTAGIAERAGSSITYVYFLKKGFPALVITVGLAAIWLFIRF